MQEIQQSHILPSRLDGKTISLGNNSSQNLDKKKEIRINHYI